MANILDPCPEHTVPPNHRGMIAMGEKSFIYTATVTKLQKGQEKPGVTT